MLHCRMLGFSWKKIGQILGISAKQAIRARDRRGLRQRCWCLRSNDMFERRHSAQCLDKCTTAKRCLRETSQSWVGKVIILPNGLPLVGCSVLLCRPTRSLVCDLTKEFKN